MFATSRTPSQPEVEQAVARAHHLRSQAFADAFAWLGSSVAAALAKLRPASARRFRAA